MEAENVLLNMPTLRFNWDFYFRAKRAPWCFLWVYFL